jgi:hypothetical protein
VLAQRTAGLAPPLQMCDALSRNVPKAFTVVLAHCLCQYPERTIIQSSFGKPP